MVSVTEATYAFKPMAVTAFAHASRLASAVAQRPAVRKKYSDRAVGSGEGAGLIVGRVVTVGNCVGLP